MTDLYSIDLYEVPMMDAIEQRNIRLVKHIIKKVQDFSPSQTLAFFNKALNQAAEHGVVKAVRLFIPLCDPKDCNSAALRWAAMGGHADCVRALIPVSNPTDHNSHALVLAAHEGSVECVKLLIKVTNPQDDGSQALILAAEGGAAECVKLLLQAPNNPMDNTQALVRALKNGFWDIVDLVYPHSDLSAAVEAMRDWGGSDENIQWLEDKIVERNNLRLNKTLTSALEPLGVERSRLKI